MGVVPLVAAVVAAEALRLPLPAAALLPRLLPLPLLAQGQGQGRGPARLLQVQEAVAAAVALLLAAAAAVALLAAAAVVALVGVQGRLHQGPAARLPAVAGLSVVVVGVGARDQGRVGVVVSQPVAVAAVVVEVGAPSKPLAHPIPSARARRSQCSWWTPRCTPPSASSRCTTSTGSLSSTTRGRPALAPTPPTIRACAVVWTARATPRRAASST